MEQTANKHRNSAVVFDLDGTLVNTSEDIAFSINHLRRRLGLRTAATPAVLKAVGRGASHLVREMLELDRDDDSLAPHLTDFRNHYAAHQGKRSVVYDGIREALDALSQTRSLFVLSNKPHSAVVQELAYHRLSQCFVRIWGAGEFDALKPDPAGVRAALTLAECAAGSGVMVGDMSVDVRTGLNAGVAPLFVTWGFGQLAPELKPAAMASRPDELPPLIARILSQAIQGRCLGSMTDH